MFDFSGTDTFTLVDMTDGLFFWVLVSRATYTLTFQDPSLGGAGRQIHPDRIGPRHPRWRLHLQLRHHERQGDVRIHETMTFMVSADGTIRVQNETFDFSGCPSA